MIDTLHINGLRGFAVEQELTFARPNGQSGSGLTVIVGPNNGGKSTIVEALRLFVAPTPPSITEGKRNSAAGSAIVVRLEAEGKVLVVKTAAVGGSETVIDPSGPGPHLKRVPFVVPSRRAFSPFFHKHYQDRLGYASNAAATLERSGLASSFPARLFAALANREQFDAVMRRVADPVPEWTIEQSDNGQYYLKLLRGANRHNSEGVGEGVISLLMMVDALYDSKPDDVIVIDEPELSLHPAYQRRLAALFAEYSKDRQIIIATHSPRFITTPDFANGQLVARVYHDGNTSRIAVPKFGTLQKVAKLAGNLNNPHVVGTDAKEAFFLDDRVVLVEGQEDVVFLPFVFAQSNIRLDADLFGWGVGGAENMRLFASLFQELGFTRVAGLLDANKADVAAELFKLFPAYHFAVIPANDIRTKPARSATTEVVGLLDASRTLRAEHATEVHELLSRITEYFAA